MGNADAERQRRDTQRERKEMKIRKGTGNSGNLRKKRLLLPEGKEEALKKVRFSQSWSVVGLKFATGTVPWFVQFHQR